MELSFSRVRQGERRTFRVKPLLRVLGLEPTARWPQVAKALKARLRESRLAQDDETAALWSEAKTFLKGNVPSECGVCRELIKARGRWCQMHWEGGRDGSR